MRETATRWQSNVHALVLHPTQPRVLMQQGPEGWSLSPFFQFGLRLPFGDVVLALQEIGHTLSTNVTAVRWTDIHYTHQGRERQVDIILTLECNDPAWVPPPHLHWIDRPTLERLASTLPQQREVIATCLREEETQTAPLLRLPWERRGWFRQAASWIQTRLEQAGRTATGPVEQIRIWGISCILRVPTTEGTLYFKSGPVPVAGTRETFPFFFANEAALIKGLAAMYPEYMPSPLAIEVTEGWMLLEDVGQVLRTQPVLDLWEEALLVFCRVQQASIGQREALLRMGCLDRSLEKLAEHIDTFMSDTEALSYLDAAEVEQLRTYTPRLKALCQQLASYNLPSTLVHGDLHSGNVAFQHGKPIFFDWADGCVSHPFLDAVTFWGGTSVFADATAARTRLRTAYLAQWLAYAPMERLIEAAQVAEILGSLYHIMRNRDISANMETPWNKAMGTWVTFWVRELLDGLAEYERTS
ncbi:MAG: phosphotransferase family protein [Ktedonobacteraceae bacterium]|jgi:hypothetical protein